MLADKDTDVEEVLKELDEAEKELINLIESPEDNTEKIKSEVDDLFDLTKKILRKYDDLISEVERLKQDMNSKAVQAEQLSKQIEDAREKIVGERTDPNDVKDEIDELLSSDS